MKVITEFRNYLHNLCNCLAEIQLGILAINKHNPLDVTNEPKTHSLCVWNTYAIASDWK